MHAKALRILERLESQARNAAAQRQRKKLLNVLARAYVLTELDKEFRLRSPRYPLCRVHFPSVSYWTHARSLPEGVCDAAYMMLLNVPRFFFEELAKQVRP